MKTADDDTKRTSSCASAFAGLQSLALALFIGIVLMSGTVGCSRHEAASGGETPLSIEEKVLYGGSPCQSDEDCPGSVCAGTECSGFLLIPSDLARDQAGERLRAAVAGKAPAARSIAAAASRVVHDPSAEVFGRARAADLFRFLPCELAREQLIPAMESNSEAVRFYASRSLALCGEEAGTRSLETFLRHASEPVKQMARVALETAKTR